MKRQEKSDARREAILDAALEQFLLKGLSSARVEDIARAAHVAKGTIYLYFSDKEAMFQALVEGVLAPALAKSQYILEMDMPLKEKLLRLYRPLLEQESDPRKAAVARLCFAEGMRAPGQMPSFYRDAVRPLMELRLNLLRRALGDHVPEALQRYPLLLTSPLVHGLLWQGMFGCDLNLSEMFRAYLDLLLPDE